VPSEQRYTLIVGIAHETSSVERGDDGGPIRFPERELVLY
jgi:hypothetical protein